MFTTHTHTTQNELGEQVEAEVRALPNHVQAIVHGSLHRTSYTSKTVQMQDEDREEVAMKDPLM